MLNKYFHLIVSVVIIKDLVNLLFGNIFPPFIINRNFFFNLILSSQILLHFLPNLAFYVRNVTICNRFKVINVRFL